jgi:ATP-dependent Clp protease protease subunit
VKKRAFMATVNNGTLELLVYEDIGQNWWSDAGVTAATITEAIRTAGIFNRISVRINSPGGNAFEGVAIYNLLRSQGKPIDVFVDGIAASAASVIAMAGDTIEIGVGAMLMIHNAMWGVYGDAAALRKGADVIENISVTIGGIYVLRTKNDAATVKTLMDAETWMGAEEAIKQGFADKVMNQDEEEVASARAIAQKFNLKVFQHAPAELKKKGIPHASVNPGCECGCIGCTETGCADCENDPCEAIGCDCPNHQEMSSEFIPDLETYRQRLALRERAA